MSLHIEAKKGEIADTILLPGDPLRAKFVAENLLEDAVCYNKVRAMYGYTGLFNGQRVSIQGTGMGMASVSLYVSELVNDYGVKNLIRVGTCGAIHKDIEVGQVILVTSASGDFGANKIYFDGLDYAATSDFSLLLDAYNAAKDLNIDTMQGSIFSTDTFYDTQANRWDKWAANGILAVEMETQILLTLGARYGVRTLSILTVSDNIITGESSSTQDREQSYMNMMKIAFSTAK
jgi:purine-nucleoside phosphorylase